MIDKNNNLVKINGGNHRFAISRILQLKKVPIEIKLISSNQRLKINNYQIFMHLKTLKRKVQS